MIIKVNKNQIRRPTIEVFIALNLSLIAAQSAKGDPEMAITRRTIILERGMMARRPALAAPAPGPNLSNKNDI